MKWLLPIFGLALMLTLLRPSSGQAMGGEIIQAPDYYYPPAQRYRFHPPRHIRHTHHMDDVATPPQSDGDQDHSRTSTK
jgi:hypothetical protein